MCRLRIFHTDLVMYQNLNSCTLLTSNSSHTTSSSSPLNMRSQKFVLYKQHSLIHQLYYSQFTLMKHINSKTDCTAKFVVEVPWLFTKQCIIKNIHACTHSHSLSRSLSLTHTHTYTHTHTVGKVSHFSRFSPTTMLTFSFAQQKNLSCSVLTEAGSERMRPWSCSSVTSHTLGRPVTVSVVMSSTSPYTECHITSIFQH